MLFILGLIMGCVIGLFASEILKELKKDTSSFELIPYKLKEKLIPQKRNYWVNPTEHYSVRFPQFLQYGYFKGSIEVFRYYKWIFRDYSFLLNPFMPREVKKLLLRDCLGYSLEDFDTLKKYYQERTCITCGFKELKAKILNSKMKISVQ